MKKIIIVLVIFSVGILSAQSNYENGMQKALSLWGQGRIDEAENMFERISNAETDQWLPHYYVAQINSIKSWNLKDETKLKAQLDKAQQHLDLAKAISKDNPEIMVLQAHVLTNWVAFDGMTYGMKYSAKISEIYNKAYAMAPKNPRVVFSKAEWAMGSAKFFGQDTKPYCAEIEKSLELFANFKPESELHPNWGEQRAKQVIKSCNE